MCGAPSCMKMFVLKQVISCKIGITCFCKIALHLELATQWYKLVPWKLQFQRKWYNNKLCCHSAPSCYYFECSCFSCRMQGLDKQYPKILYIDLSSKREMHFIRSQYYTPSILQRMKLAKSILYCGSRGLNSCKILILY